MPAAADLVIRTTHADTARDWRDRLAALMPERAVHIWPEVPRPERIGYALVWRPPAGMAAQLPNLAAVLTLSAGVDHLANDPTLDPAIPVIRLSGPALARQLAGHALHFVLRHHRGFDRYDAQQQAGLWQPHPIPLADDCRVGVLGLGAIGQEIADLLLRLGYDVAGWARTPRTGAFPVFTGADGLDALLARSDILVNVLPLTPATTGLIDGRALARLPAGAALINIGRGPTVDTAALLCALDSGGLSRAVLDVFETEPLPADSPLWRHPRVTVTPHIAGDVQPAWGAAAAARLIRELEAGKSPPTRLDRASGY